MVMSYFLIYLFVCFPFKFRMYYLHYLEEEKDEEVYTNQMQ